MRGAHFRRTCGQRSGDGADQAVHGTTGGRECPIRSTHWAVQNGARVLTRSGTHSTFTGGEERRQDYVASHDRRCPQLCDLVMRSVAGRLIVLLAIGAVFTVFAFVRAWSEGGEPRVVYLIFGCLALVGLLLILIGWVRQSKRR
jgi:hypothetical protein